MADQRLCTIPGCGKKHEARGLCALHYYRMKKSRPLDAPVQADHGAPQAFFDRALTMNTDECVIWPYAKDADGYAKGRIGGSQYVSRAVCIAKHGEPPTPEHQSAHSCRHGGDGCINWKHLRWATPLENIRDKALHGTQTSGEDHPLAKLKEQEVREIRARLSMGERLVSLAKRFGVSDSCIAHIRDEDSWGSVS